MPARPQGRKGRFAMVKRLNDKVVGAITIEKCLVYLNDGTDCHVSKAYWRNGKIVGFGSITSHNRFAMLLRKNKTSRIMGEDKNGKFDYK